MRQDHIIPLSPQAMAIIERMRPLTERTGYVFYNFERSNPYSEVWFNQALKRMGYTGDPYPKMTGHGFRQLASTGLYELQFPENIIEVQLAHLEQSSVKKRYDLSAHLAERQIMMNRWADHLDDLRAGKAVSFDLLTPSEVSSEISSRRVQATDIELQDKETLIKGLQAQGILPDLLAQLASQMT
ncbi:phage integrase [Psychrobacter sp. JCM 18900]|nr:phage integrase [Psychrobacter sp. JCM 18900]